MRAGQMERIPTMLWVVAAVIRDEAGRILLQQGLPGKRHAGQWEFPGGKVDSGETPRDALAREVREELGLALDPAAMQPIGFAEEPAAEGRPALVLLLYTCGAWQGVPQALEGQEWGWFSENDAASLVMPPMDRALLATLTNASG